MVTVLRESGMRVVIYRDHHAPAHVHVYGNGSAKVELGGEDEQPRIVDAEDMKFSDLRKAKRIVAAHKDELMAKWTEFHG